MSSADQEENLVLTANKICEIKFLFYVYLKHNMPIDQFKRKNHKVNQRLFEMHGCFEG